MSTKLALNRDESGVESHDRADYIWETEDWAIRTATLEEALEAELGRLEESARSVRVDKAILECLERVKILVVTLAEERLSVYEPLLDAVRKTVDIAADFAAWETRHYCIHMPYRVRWLQLEWRAVHRELEGNEEAELSRMRDCFEEVPSTLGSFPKIFAYDPEYQRARLVAAELRSTINRIRSWLDLLEEAFDGIKKGDAAGDGEFSRVRREMINDICAHGPLIDEEKGLEEFCELRQQFLWEWPNFWKFFDQKPDERNALLDEWLESKYEIYHQLCLKYLRPYPRLGHANPARISPLLPGYAERKPFIGAEEAPLDTLQHLKRFALREYEAPLNPPEVLWKQILAMEKGHLIDRELLRPQLGLEEAFSVEELKEIFFGTRAKLVTLSMDGELLGFYLVQTALGGGVCPETWRKIQALNEAGYDIGKEFGWAFLVAADSKLSGRAIRLGIDPYAWLTQAAVDAAYLNKAIVLYGRVRGGTQANTALNAHKRVGGLETPVELIDEHGMEGDTIILVQLPGAASILERTLV